MKKVISVICVFILVFFVLFFYFTRFSYSAMLNKNDFSARDVIASEGYSIDSNHLTKVLLCVDSNKLGIIGAANYGFGIWKETNFGSIIKNPGSGQFATSTMIIPKNPGINGYTEKHIFIAGFVDFPNKPRIKGNSDFYLNIDYYPIDNKVLLFAHAIGGRDMVNFGSSQILQYITEQINVNKE
ncbi:hypothetical protein J23TS9_18880 [Paenibacillus sp. J23TS9]|uniref:hypothetical protein n=1 Tax=Paenibacillus sp. J23TS9 TaxID=2807193 RepID=UPI001AFD9A62|nr:hypothetical protein [Paenibacillus sp. J23TS9]GIP26758.1 hypothetical protein J23TS9_18880 [Paenibacillus sp. J23TS9]